jgi:methyltransferase-like protein
VRLQAKQGEPVTNRRHERVYLDSLAVHLLPLLDGKLGRDALIDGLARAVSDGALVLELGERRTAGIEEIRAVLASELDQKLAQFAQQALLVG